MYLSTLLINVGTNPDRPRPGRLWLRNLYHVHQRLCMAFPSNARKKCDPEFLAPYAPEDFPKQIDLADRQQTAAHVETLAQVHALRGPRNGFLFRIDPQPGGGVVIVVQSATEPVWDYAFQNARMFLDGPPETREYDPTFQAGQALRFRIRVNLSKKIKKSRDGTDLRKTQERSDSKGRPRIQSKRVALTWEEGDEPDAMIRSWFASKGERCGFILRTLRVLHLGWMAGYRVDGQTDSRMKFRSALLEGTLRVTDATAFALAVAAGIGSAKAFGFGLLSVARGD